MNDVAWDNVTELDKLGGFHGVIGSFEQYPRDWHAWYTHAEPETLPLIGQKFNISQYIYIAHIFITGEWEDICNEFQKILFVRSLRQDRISFCTSTFIVNQLGSKFIEPPVLDIKTVFEESIAQTPLIFVLSPGVDPTTALMQLAETCKMTQRFHSLSLGQGQAPIATR